MTPTMIANISWAVIVVAATTLNHFGILSTTILDIIYGFAGYQGAVSSYKATINGLVPVTTLKQSNVTTTITPKEN